MNHTKSLHFSDAHAGLEARFGLRVASALNQRGELACHDVSERLRVAREQALARAAAGRRIAIQSSGASTVVGMTARGAAMLGGHPMWWTRLASVLPILALLGGLLLIDQWHDRAQIAAAADVDAALLADDLPPAAYSDPGFVEFLKTPRE